MSERQRILVLTLIVTMACASAIGITLFLTYSTHLAQERERLAVTAQSQARLIEAVTRFNAEYSSDYAGGSEKATLSQIVNAHENFVGFGETGDFMLARREGDLIVFQFRHRHGEIETPAPIPLSSDLAEPMRLALSGLSGTVIGLDYRGTVVLAAHEPVGELNMGIVAKIDLAEVRAPFIRAASAASGLALLIVVTSMLLFRRIGNPIIARLEASLKGLEQEVDERKQVEERLQITQYAVDHVSDSVTLTGADGQFAYVNESMSRRLGYSREELLSMGVRDIDPDFPAEAWLDHWENLKEEGSLTFESRHRTKDGRVFPVEIVANHVEFGGKEYNFAYARDISERKRAEGRLRDSEERSRAWLECSPVCTKIVDLDFNLRYMSTAGIEGLGIDDITPYYGRPYPFEFYPESFRTLMTKNLELVKRTGEITTQEASVVDIEGNELWFHSTLVPVNDDEGRIDYIIVVSVDTTERKRAEEALEENMQLTQILLDSMPCIALLLRPHSREIVALNHAAREAGAVLGKTCYATWPKFDEPCPWCMAPEQWATGEERHLELESIGVIWDAHWIPVSDDLYMHYAFDITERKKAEQQTEDSLSEKEALLREIHHRVKNNMQVIVSLLRMHARRSQSPQVQEIFQDCQERVGAMALIHETLYQSEGLARIDFEVYLEKLCQNLVRVHGEGLGSIAVVPEATDVSLGMDQAVAVGMVVGELVSNAFKHAFPGGREGRVTVSLRETDDRGVELVVEDDGVGLPDDVDPANTETLGLQLVSATATDELGGTLEVKRGDGTRFTLRFKNRLPDEGGTP